MTKIYRALLIAFLGWTLFFCQDSEISPGKKVELYLLESFETVDNTCQIDEEAVKLQDWPLIGYSDFVSYDASEHIFELSDPGNEYISDQGFTLHGEPFAITVDGEIIYTGYFWAGFSSTGCLWVVTDPFFADDIGLQIQLGYPGEIDGVEIPDRRNDPRILATFRQDGKLIE